MKKDSSVARALKEVSLICLEYGRLPKATSLLKSCVDLREKALLGLLYDTGMRKSELLHLRTYNMDFSRAMIHLTNISLNRNEVSPWAQEA